MHRALGTQQRANQTVHKLVETINKLVQLILWLTRDVRHDRKEERA